MIQAGVIVKTRFVDKQIEAAKNSKTAAAKVQSFQSYIDYMDRDDAVRNKHFTKYNFSSQKYYSFKTKSFEKYHDYMDNPEKTTGLFTSDFDTLSAAQKRSLKNAFQQAYDNDSIMWQTVVSFDTQMLTKLGIYYPQSGYLNESRIKNMVRDMMKTTLKEENMQNSAVWSASIHYNTQHIHVHLAFTEPKCTREKILIDGQERPRGCFPAKTFKKMKSTVVNGLLDRDRTQIDDIMRKTLIGSMKQSVKNDDFKWYKNYYRIYHRLPDDMRLWHYNMSAMKKFRPMIDNLSREYIMNYHAKEYAQLQQLLMKEQSVFKEAYGLKSTADHYAENKMRDLYTRMGNVVLNQMATHRKFEQFSFNRNISPLGVSQRMDAISNLKVALTKAFYDESRQNEYEYKKLEFELQQ